MSFKDVWNKMFHGEPLSNPMVDCFFDAIGDLPIKLGVLVVGVCCVIAYFTVSDWLSNRKKRKE